MGVTQAPEWCVTAVHANYGERDALSRPAALRIWSYTGRLSYQPGEPVSVHISTTAPYYAVQVLRDGAAAVPVFARERMAGYWHDTPEDCGWRGCGWPVAFAIPTSADWPSGVYIVRVRALDADDTVRDIHEHLFILTPAPGRTRTGRLLQIAASGSWTAYNDWGGSNHYQGYWGPARDQFAPILSLERPFARGFVVLPDDAPRAVLQQSPPRLSEPRYPHMEWAFCNGFSKKYMSASWAAFDRHFLRWAEANGYAVDIISHVDLHYRPELLEGYATIVMAGHDEYWTWAMRDAVEAFAVRGGKVARFAGNFLWQIRLEDEGRRQVCYKDRARAEDPLMQTGPRHLVTEAWEAPEIGRPGARTFGLNALRGMYAGWSGASPRGARGFPIYRPEHWAFAETGLYYGDVLGADSAIFGYEVDGLDYEIRGGLPVPARPDDVPAGLEILGLGLASTGEEGPTITEGRAFLGREDMKLAARVLKGSETAAALEATKRGCGCIVSFPMGRGEVFHAGTCDWVAGLLRKDEMVEQVTHNVLRRFLAGSAAR